MDSMRHIWKSEYDTSADATMAERSEGKGTYEFTNNFNDRTNLLEEMVKQDEFLITRSNSNLNKCGFEKLDIQEETPAVSKFLNNSLNVNRVEKFINEKNSETVLNKPGKCSMGSYQNFFSHLLNKIQFLRKEVRMKNIIIKSLLLSKSSKHNKQNLSYIKLPTIISMIKTLFNLKLV